MTPEIWYNILAGAGVAGAWVLCLATGQMFTKGHVDDLRDENKSLRAENTELKEARRLADERAEAERRRGDAAVETANTANVLLAGIRKGISQRVD